LNNAESIKAKLKKQAIENGKLFQDELVAYCLERTIYRISVSKYRENFTLKGGIFLYAVFGGEFPRGTRDIDLLARWLDNEIDVMKKVFEEIFAIESDDAIIYKTGSLSIRTIAEFKEYQGINISITAMLDRTQVPVSIDIGFGDVVYPERVMMEFPVVLEMDPPRIYVYSLASVIAEKFEAIVSLGYANSRYKDYYDIYILSNEFDFTSKELSLAIIETFRHRETTFDDITVFEDGFAEDRIRKTRWQSFVKKKRALLKLELSEVIEGIRIFLGPIVEGIITEDHIIGEWIHSERVWRWL